MGRKKNRHREKVENSRREKSRVRKSKAEIYELFMLGLCVYVLVALMAMTFFPLSDSTASILNHVDSAICILFLADFFVKLTLAENKLRYLKWGWIDLVSSIPMWDPLRWGRFARVVRILRLLRGVRSSKHLVAYILRRRAESAFTAAALTALLVVVFSSVAILQFERDSADANINSPEDALWWAFVTVTTVGYGDKYPMSVGGRVVAAVAMTAGVGLFGTFTGFVASWFLQPVEEEQETELERIEKKVDALERKLDRISQQLSSRKFS